MDPMDAGDGCGWMFTRQKSDPLPALIRSNDCGMNVIKYMEANSKYDWCRPFKVISHIEAPHALILNTAQDKYVSYC